MDESLARFVALYQQLSSAELHRLPEVYGKEVIFIDPAHRIEGLAALTDYFAVLYRRLAYCRFDITSQLLQGRQAWLGWTGERSTDAAEGLRLLVLHMQLGLLLPPHGMLLMTMRGVAPPEVGTGQIFRAVTPYVLMTILLLVAVFFVPGIASWLPGLIA